MLKLIDNVVDAVVGLPQAITNAVESFFRSNSEFQKRILLIIMALILFVVYVRWWIWGEGLI